MWQCKVCDTKIEEDQFDACWNCGTSRGLTLEQQEQLRREVAAETERKKKQMLVCLRCGDRMAYNGTRKFREGASWGFWLGDVGELLVNKIALDLFLCRTCGKVELYADGIGEDMRDESAS